MLTPDQVLKLKSLPLAGAPTRPPPIGEAISTQGQKLISVTSVEACDARGGDSSNEVGYKKYLTINLKSAPDNYRD